MNPREGFETPESVEGVLDGLDREAVIVEVDLTERNDALDRLASRVVWGLLFAAGALSTTVLVVFSDFLAAQVTASATVLVGLFFARAMRGRRRGLSVSPSFTRHNMRR